jgi:hypothetical protein
VTERVHVVGPYGERGTVPAAEADAVVKGGGRLATAEEIAHATLQAQYDAQSTAKKVGGVASSVFAGPIASNALAASGAVAVQPGVEAFDKGLASPVTLGLDRVAVDQALKATAGHDAAKAYAKHMEDLSKAHGTAETLGELTGFAALAAGGNAGGGAARAIPGVGVSALGGAAEGAVARGLAGMVGQGVVGRAVTSAGSLAARGAVEGALYSGAQEFSEEMLGDHEVAADRIFAASGMGALYGAVGGAALGGAGSLAKSGVKAAGEAVGGGLARMASGTKLGAAPGAITDFLENAAKTETQKGWAYDQAWKAAGGGQGLQSTRHAKQAARYLPNGTTDLGEVMVRHGVIDVADTVTAAAMSGKAADMLPKAAAAEAAVGQRIGDLTMKSGASVAHTDIARVIDDVAKGYEGKAGQRHIGASIRDYGAELRDVLGMQPGGPPVTVQALLEQRKALDQVAYQEAKALDPKMRVQGLRDVRAGLEDLIADSMDAASGRVSGDLKAEYKLLKKDFMGLRMINEVLEDSAARQAKAATFGLTSTIVGAASGGIGTGMLAAVGTKLAKERGNAAAAVLLYKMAESGAITNTIQSVNARIGKAATGLLNPAPAAHALSSTNPVAIATRAQNQIANLTSSPNAVANRAAVVTQGLGTLAPNVAGRVAANMTRALAFLNSKLPPARNVDPLAPTQQRTWNHQDATRFARYVEAAEDPAGVLDDVATGKVTPEAIETLRVLAPTLYRDLQVQTLDAIATQLAKGKPITFDARIKLGTLLGIQADPSQNPRVRAFLQANVITPAPAPAGGNMQQTPGAPASKPISIKTQHTAFDRLAESGPGRR